MTTLELLEGKYMSVMTDMLVMVELQIESVKQDTHVQQITPDTRENDWWGETKETHSYIVTFTNGATKKFNSINDINVK
jgi:hypothetical protein